MLFLEVQPHELLLFVSKVSHRKTNEGVIGGSLEQQELAQPQHLDESMKNLKILCQNFMTYSIFPHI